MVISEVKRKIVSKPNFFWLITIIITLGITLFLGATSLKKSMLASLEDNFKNINIMDLKINTNVNFDNSDKEYIEKIDGVKSVYMSKNIDATTKINGDDVNVLLNSIKYDDDYINKLVLSKGRFPKTLNEAVVDESFYKRYDISFNDLLTLTTSGNSIRAKKIKIVGVAKNNVQDDVNGSNNYIYLNENEFSSAYYNNIYIIINNPNKINSIKKEIKNIYNNKKEKLIQEKQIDKDIAEEELNNLYSSTLPQDELSDEIKELTDNLEKVKDELNKISNSKLEIQSKDNISVYKLYKEDANNISKTLNIYTFIFLIITISTASVLLISYIDKDEKEINTLKKMGYSNIYIYSKYILYLLLSTFISFVLSIILYRTILLIFGLFYKYYFGIYLSKIKISVIGIIITILIILIINTVTILGYILKKKLFNKIIKYTPIVLFIIASGFIFAGYNLNKEVINISNKQFSSIHKYKYMVKNYNNNDIGLSIYKDKININNKSVNIIVPNNIKNVNKYININGSINNKEIIITNKLANKLKVKENDYVTIKINNIEKKIKISKITKNYIDDYVYMSPTLYKKITDKEISYNEILLTNKDKKAIKNIDSEKITSKKELKKHYESLLKPTKIAYSMIVILGIILIILINYSYILLLDNKTNRSYVNMGYNKHSLIKKYYNKLFDYPLLIITGIIVGNIMLLISILLVNNYLYNFRFTFNIGSYVLYIITIIIVTWINEFVINHILKVKKM